MRIWLSFNMPKYDLIANFLRISFYLLVQSPCQGNVDRNVPYLGCGEGSGDKLEARYFFFLLLTTGGKWIISG